MTSLGPNQPHVLSLGNLVFYLAPQRPPPEYVQNMPWYNPLFAHTTAAVGWPLVELTSIGSLVFNATDAQELGLLRDPWQEGLLPLFDKWFVHAGWFGFLLPFGKSGGFPQVVDCFSFSLISFGIAGTLVYLSSFHLEFDDPIFFGFWD